MKHLIMIGAPGSGKGTQAEKLAAEKKYNHVSTGDLLRAEVAKASELGLRVKAIMESGELVSDAVVLELLKANIDLASDAYIFDGYPRNIDQAKALNAQILGDTDYTAVYFVIDTEVLVERLTNRRVCKDCGAIYNLVGMAPKKAGICDKCSGELFHRKDDNEEVIRNRIDVYNGTVEPMLNYYAELNRLEKIDVAGGKENTFKTLLSVIG